MQDPTGTLSDLAVGRHILVASVSSVSHPLSAATTAQVELILVTLPGSRVMSPGSSRCGPHHSLATSASGRHRYRAGPMVIGPSQARLWLPMNQASRPI
jgi:hypothetical protein